MYPLFGDTDNRTTRQFYIESWQLVLAELAGHNYDEGSTRSPIEAAGMTLGVYDQAMKTLVAAHTDTDGSGIGPREAAQLTPKSDTQTHTHPVVVDIPGVRVETNTGGSE